jgi:type II secretion system protein H
MSWTYAGDRVSGFSLIELMIVVVLIGIMAGIGVPSFNGMIDRGRVDRAADRLVADVSHTRMLAVRSANPATIWLSTDSYRIQSVAQNGETVERTVSLSGSNLALDVPGGEMELIFDSRGLLGTTVDTEDVIAIVGPRGKRGRVEITPLGRAHRVK